MREDGDYVVYWMTMQRRPHFNWALQRAIEYAAHLQKPLIVLEALRCDYRWASHRFHRFIMQGMHDNLRHFKDTKVVYYPYLEPSKDKDKGLLKALSEHACVVVTDEFPCYFLPHMLEAATRQVKCLLEAVDGNGLLPLRAPEKAFERAVDFRRYLQKNLAFHLQHQPKPNPLVGQHLVEGKVPAAILKKWPAASDEDLTGSLDDFPIDASVAPVAYSGGFQEGEHIIQDFLDHRLQRYASERSQPGDSVASGLSPYLHFGHASIFDVLHRLGEMEKWNPSKMTRKANGKKEGTWGMSEGAEAFLDEIVTWRELGYVYCHYRADYEKYESLPEWARKTLEAHQDDVRDPHYTLAELEACQTYDEIWNAAQRQLTEEGRIHNYLRMLWGKKVLEWAANPRQALEILIELNNKYAVDGRNPNSYSGIFWCLGRFDRPWFEREIFGSIRYMSSDSTKRKFKMDKYMARWGKK